MLTAILSRAVLAVAGLCMITSTASAATAGEAPISVSTALGQSVMKTGQRATVHLRIGIKGTPIARTETRTPMNIVLVIDRSGSMQGPRIEAARQAAIMAVDRLDGRDIISVVSYDDRTEVEVPATRATDKYSIKNRISRLTPRGSTAIYAGLQAGASELRKFKSKDRVNKIILLSDGLANVGPSNPKDFAGLGRELASEGITVSTIGLGLGYNEDLMTQLAIAADGSHKFVAEPADLAQFFNREFDDAQNVVAQEIEINIDCVPGVKPIRSLGRDAKVSGSRISYKVNQIIGGTDQVLIAELDVPAEMANEQRQLAEVKVAYRVTNGEPGTPIAQPVQGRFSLSDSEVKAGIDADVMRDVTVLQVREKKDEAIRLRDAGRLDEAQKKFKDNAEYVRAQQKRYGFGSSAPIDQEVKANDAAAAPSAMSGEEWSKTRKTLREGDTNQAGGRIKY